MLGTFILLVCGAVTAFVLWCLEQKRKFRCLSHLPGPVPLPVIGSVLDFGDNAVDVLINLCRIQREHGNICRVWLGPKNVNLLVSDPDLVEFILSSPKYIMKSVDYDLLRPILGNGLLTSSGAYWHRQRKIITPTFHFKILEQFLSIFNSSSNILINNLSKETNKDICNIYPYITHYTLDTICETAMGTSVNAQGDSNSPYVQSIKSFCNILIHRTFNIWKRSDFLFKFASEYKSQRNSLDIIHGFTNSVIQNRKKELLSNGSAKEEMSDEFGTKKRTAFLDLLLKSAASGSGLTDENIREEVDTFMFEGHDTTGSAISFALYEISRNPDVQAKIVEELSHIFTVDKFREPTHQDLSDMKYIELVIKETLRLYPSVPFFARKLSEDTYYKGTKLPAGLTVVIFTYYMHRRADIFTNPEKFDPERFSIENAKDKHPYSYVPFSAGPRNCIGQKFAMMEMKTTLAKLLRVYEFSSCEPADDVVLSGEVILKSRNGVWLKIKKRNF